LSIVNCDVEVLLRPQQMEPFSNEADAESRAPFRKAEPASANHGAHASSSGLPCSLNTGNDSTNRPQSENPKAASEHLDDMLDYNNELVHAIVQNQSLGRVENSVNYLKLLGNNLLRMNAYFDSQVPFDPVQELEAISAGRKRVVYGRPINDRKPCYSCAERFVFSCHFRSCWILRQL